MKFNAIFDNTNFDPKFCNHLTNCGLQFSMTE